MYCSLKSQGLPTFWGERTWHEISFVFWNKGFLFGETSYARSLIGCHMRSSSDCVLIFYSSQRSVKQWRLPGHPSENSSKSKTNKTTSKTMITLVNVKYRRPLWLFEFWNFTRKYMLVRLPMSLSTTQARGIIVKLSDFCTGIETLVSYLFVETDLYFTCFMLLWQYHYPTIQYNTII
jgi:hypothetical protein